MRYLIQNGLICDGSGRDCFRADILIENEKIALVGQNLKITDAEILEAEGRLITPGFIDSHRHCDLEALINPDFGDIELHQGITSVVGSNCGLGIYPVTKKYRKAIYDFVEPCLGKAPESLVVSGYADYMKRIEKKGMPLHVGGYIGTGTVKAAIKGYGKTPFSYAEMEKAKTCIREALEEGCLGISMGIMYQPECYSSQEEMQELLSAATPFQRIVACHIRGEGDQLVSSVREIIELCRNAELPLNISHFKVTGLDNWGWKIEKAIEIIEEARSRGQDISADFYPYCGGSTTLLSLLPPDCMGDTLEETIDRLGTAAGKEQLRREIYRENRGWDNIVRAIGWKRIMISSVISKENASLAGRDFMSAAAGKGYEDPVDLMAELLCQEKGKVGIIVMSMSQEDVDRVAKLPYTMLISDALYGAGDCPHPRLYGSFPKFLEEYVWKRNVLSLEEAVCKMTFMPAKRLGLENRGLIEPGYYADLAIFRENKLKSPADYENAKQLCSGFEWVFADGIPVLQNDRRCLVEHRRSLRR